MNSHRIRIPTLAISPRLMRGRDNHTDGGARQLKEDPRIDDGGDDNARHLTQPHPSRLPLPGLRRRLNAAPAFVASIRAILVAATVITSVAGSETVAARAITSVAGSGTVAASAITSAAGNETVAATAIISAAGNESFAASAITAANVGETAPASAITAVAAHEPILATNTATSSDATVAANPAPSFSAHETSTADATQSLAQDETATTDSPTTLTGFAPAPADAVPSLLGDESIPPSEQKCTIRVVDASTGAPVPGVAVRVAEDVTTYYCFRYVNGTCIDCDPRPEWQTQAITTDAQGVATATFQLPWCVLIDDSPPTWIKRVHAGWRPPSVIENPSTGVYSPWILHHYEVGPSPYAHTLFVTKESELAERFAPVLHRHGALEVQDDLADVQETVLGHARIQGYDVLGRNLYNGNPPPIDVHDHSDWDTCGEGYAPSYWRLDIDNDWRRAGAPAGARPLYVHVFPYEGGAIVQYWLWFNGNDLRNLPGGSGTLHEGDWEYISIRIVPLGDSWAPARVNLSQHAGGQVMDPGDVWWSPTTEPSYRDLEPGYSPARTHPHVWVAANSHAMYSRFTPQYHITVDMWPLCDDDYSDRVDYNHGGHPSGDHAFFRWDRLVDTGEYWFDPHAHGETFRNHAHGGNIEALKLFCRFGESLCSDGDDCEACANPLYQIRSWAPRSPIIGEEPHRWRRFEDTPGRWGNAPSFPADVSWREATQIGNYLGAFATCGDGNGDVVRTRIGNAPAGVPGIAKIRVVTGDIEVFDATDGEIYLEPTNDGWYQLELSAVLGTGTLEIDVHPQGSPQQVLARGLTAEIRTCGTSDVEDEPGALMATDFGRITPSTGAGPFTIDFSNLPRELLAWTIHDATGRLVAGGPIDGDRTSWEGVDGSARPLPSGLYFVRAENKQQTLSLGRVLIIR